MHATAHEVRTPYGSLHWKLTLGEKSLVASIGESNPRQYCICLSGRRPTTGAIPPIPYDSHVSYSRVGSDFSLLPCDTVRESALKVGPRRKKSLAAPGTRTLVRIAPGFSADAPQLQLTHSLH